MSLPEIESRRCATNQFQADELNFGGRIFYVVLRVEGIEKVTAKLRKLAPIARLAIAQMQKGELEATMLTLLIFLQTIVQRDRLVLRENTPVRLAGGRHGG